MTKTVSRRTAIAALGVALATGATILPADAGGHPDAELLALGEAWEEAFKAAGVAWSGCKAAEPVFYTRYFADIGGEDILRLDPLLVRFKAIRDETGYEAMVERASDIDDRVIALVRQILDAPVHTADGLLVKAKVMLSEVVGLKHLENKPRDQLDWDHEVIVIVLDQIAAFANRTS